MSDYCTYTPSTDEVRYAWEHSIAGALGGGEESFDRWLESVRADHEKAVRERIAQAIEAACPTATTYPWPEAFVAAARIAREGA